MPVSTYDSYARSSELARMKKKCNVPDIAVHVVQCLCDMMRGLCGGTAWPARAAEARSVTRCLGSVLPPHRTCPAQRVTTCSVLCAVCVGRDRRRKKKVEELPTLP